MRIGRARVQRVLTTPLAIVALLAATASTLGQDQPATPEPGAITDLVLGEAFIDAFYSWDAVALAATMDAPLDADRTLYYQAWAEAGNYRIQTRRPCTHVGRIECRITVTDDIGAALGYVATDTFWLTIEAGRIIRVESEGDDPPVFEAVFAWMGEDRPQVFTGPCKDLFAGGTTPADCVRAVVQAARDFSQRPGYATTLFEK